MKLNWTIESAEIDFSTIEKEDTKNVLMEAASLWKKKKFKKAIKSLPPIVFEFNADGMDSPADQFLKEKYYTFTVDPENELHTVSMSCDDDEISLSFSIVFDVETVDGVAPDELQEWLDENGGWYAGSASGDWSYSEDLGGYVEVVRD